MRVAVSAAEPVTGRVRVVMGAFRTVVPLEAGRATVRLPQRRPGRYAVRVDYLGTADLAPSTTRRTLVVQTTRATDRAQVGPGLA